MGIMNVLKALDRLGLNHSLNVSGNPEQRTAFGGILWLFGVLLIIAYAVNAVVSYTQRDKMSWNEDTEDHYMGTPTDLAQERLFPMFIVGTPNGNLAEEEVARMFQVTFELTLRKHGGSQTFFDVVPCKDISPERIQFSKANVENFADFEGIFNTYMFCIDPKDKKAILSGSPDGLVNTTYSNLVFKPCLTTTPDCDPNQDLTNVFVTLVKVNRVLNLHNLTNPVKYFWNFEDQFYITRNQEQRLRLFLMQYQVFDQKGFPYTKTLASRFAQFEKQNRVLLDRNNVAACEPGKACPWYLSFVMTSGGRIVKITRVYKSFAEVLGEIGGFRTIVMIGILFLFKFSSSGSPEATLVEHVYGLKPNSSHHFSCCKKKRVDDPNRDPQALSLAAIDLAHASILKTLDIRTIVREISMVKVLSLALLTEQQHEVVPWAMVNADMKLIDVKRKAGKTKAQSPKTSEKVVSPDVSNLATTLVDGAPTADVGEIDGTDADGDQVRERSESIQESLMNSLKRLEEPTVANIMQTIENLRIPDNNPENEADKGPDNSSGGHSTFQKKFDSVLAELLKGPILLPSHEAKLPT